MPKSKKSASEKAAKEKSLKSFKEKPEKEKKGKKKAKAEEVKVESTPVEKPAKAIKKPSLPRKKVITAAEASPVASNSIEASISSDDIALRAYYIAERRRAMGWPGDSTSDWVEAELQLRTEAGLLA
ncbi:MAG TPA: hypothetical protein VIM48_07505 [Chthoniobacterales bacterium]